MLLERLPLEHLGEQVRRILCRLQVLHRDQAGAAQLAHFVQLALDVPRVLRGRVPVAKVVRPLVVGLHLDGAVVVVSDELEEAADVDQLDGASC